MEQGHENEFNYSQNQLKSCTLATGIGEWVGNVVDTNSHNNNTILYGAWKKKMKGQNNGKQLRIQTRPLIWSN